MKRSLSEPRPGVLGSPTTLSGVLLPSLHTPPRPNPESASSFHSSHSGKESSHEAFTSKSIASSPLPLKILLSPPQRACSPIAPSGEDLLKCIEDEDTRSVKAILEAHPRLVNFKKRDNGQTPLMTAIRAGHPHIADYLLSVRFVDVNMKDFDNWTAIVFAAEKGWTQLTKKLIEDFHAEVNSVTSDGMSALMIASINGHLSVVNILLDVSDLDINRFDSLGYTALMYATENGHLEVVKTLIEKGHALVTLHGANSKYTSLEIAIKNGYDDILKYFNDFSYGFEERKGVKDSEESKVVKLVRTGNLTVIRQLVDELVVDVNAILPNEWTMLGLSIDMGQTSITKFLLSKFHDPRNPIDLEIRNKGGKTALMLAASKGDFHIVDEILTMISEKNVNAVDFDGMTALMHGIQYFNIVKVLIERGLAKVNIRHNVQSPLCWGVMKSNTEVVKYLIEHTKADVNMVNQYKQSPLMLSILAANDPSIVSYLLSRNDVDVNMQDSYGVTAFMHAVSPRAKWKFDAFELFEDCKVDISIRDTTGNTAITSMIEGASYLTLPSLLRRLIQRWNPDFMNIDNNGNSYLHTICSLPNVDSSALDIMLGCGVPVDKPNNEGKTPLMFAAIADNLEAAQWLIEIGNADPNRICKAGYSVVMYTVQNYHSQVGAYLIDEVKVDLSLVGPDGKTVMEQKLDFEHWREQQTVPDET